jgi:dTDP-glucose pyrophosphorylase
MKAVILAGGLGTRISEETRTKPKPVVKIDPRYFHPTEVETLLGDLIIAKQKLG